MKFFTAILAITLLLLVKTASVQAQGDIQAINGVFIGGMSPYIVGYVVDSTIGWAFSSSQDITIDSLGWLFAGTNAPSIAVVSIGLWSTDGTLLRSTMIGSSSVSINGSLYESISPLLVSAGSILVVAAGESTGQTFNVVAPPASLIEQPINYVGWAYTSGNGFTFPIVQPYVDDPGEPAPGATFLFQTVPEPSEFALGALGALLLGFRRWRNSLR
jgi:hypothetical protein